MTNAIRKVVHGYAVDRQRQKQQLNVRLAPKSIALLEVLAKRLETTRSGLAADLLEAAIAEAVNAYKQLPRNENPVDGEVADAFEDAHNETYATAR